MAFDPVNYSSDLDISAIPQTPNSNFDDLFNDDGCSVDQAGDYQPHDVDTGSELDSDLEGFSDVDAECFPGLGRREDDEIRSNVPVDSQLPDEDADHGDPVRRPC